MKLFDAQCRAMDAFLANRRAAGAVRDFGPRGRIAWPEAPRANLVLGQDAAVELGNPEDGSASFVLCTDDAAAVTHGRITLVGPDVPELKGTRRAFAKVVTVAGLPLGVDDGADRYRLLEQVRYDIHLKGYMMRGVSQFQREWSRISHAAVAAGLCFEVIGGALIERMACMPGVDAVEVLFVTSGRRDVQAVGAVGEQVVQIIGAMTKMSTESVLDCDTCRYAPVCAEVAALRAMRRQRRQAEAAGHGSS